MNPSKVDVDITPLDLINHINYSFQNNDVNVVRKFYATPLLSATIWLDIFPETKF